MKRIAVITGASSGMGRDMARELCRHSSVIDELWLIARRKERLLLLSGELSEKGMPARIIEGDLLDENFLKKLEALLSENSPRILFLVNASGFGKIGTTEALSDAVQGEMVSLNCTALTRLTRICLPYMADRFGRIINFASAAAFLPQPSFAVYAATKAYVLSFSEALSEELRKRRIAVTAVCPGPVKTEFFDIAEEAHSIPLYKHLFMADSVSVVQKALRDSLKGRKVSVYGVSMKGFRLLAKVLPHRLLLFLMRFLG